MKVTLVTVNGTEKVHKAGCRDIARDLKNSDSYNDEGWTFEATSRHHVHTEIWGDVASDYFEEGTQEWHDECDSYESTVNYLACTKDLPETDEEQTTDVVDETPTEFPAAAGVSGWDHGQLVDRLSLEEALDVSRTVRKLVDQGYSFDHAFRTAGSLSL